VLHGGAVRTDPDGATVGHWRTHVQALAVRTLGLGGDSELRHDRHGLHLGPQRVTPICRLAEDCGAAAARHCLAEEDPDGGPDGERFAVYALGPGRPPDGATARQRAVLDLLAGGPCSVLRLVRETGCLRPAFLELDGLAERQIVRRYAFTPTDALHVLGRLNLWDADLARRQAGRLGGLCGLDAETFAARVETLTVQRVARELLMTRLADLTGSRRVEVETGFVARALLDRILGVSHDALSVEATLGAPVIGIGAPAGFFLPAAAARLRAEAVIPVDGDVANAIGAITSGVRVERRATVVADERGAYHVQGLPGAPVFQELDRAQAFAAKALRRAVTEAARKAGAGAVQIDVRSEDRIARTADGMELFVGRNVTVCATGRPSTARATG
jgi:N-methylhydantoinase A/oxoprolinase/acetone carboxylase beta subunit